MRGKGELEICSVGGTLYGGGSEKLTTKGLSLRRVPSRDRSHRTKLLNFVQKNIAAYTFILGDEN